MFVLLMSDRLCMVVVSLLKCVLRQAVVDLAVVRRFNCCLVYNAFHLAGTSQWTFRLPAAIAALYDIVFLRGLLLQ